MSRRRALLATGLLLLALSGCGGPPRAAAPERFVLAGSAGQNLLILPLNVTVPMPEKLEAESPVVWDELEDYLQRQGKELKTVAFADARRIWIESIREVRNSEQSARAGFDDAARVLVKRLARHAEFDTVIIPSLFVREAPILDKTASWDGVEREVEIEAVDREVRTSTASTALEGAAPAASLHVAVLDSEGFKLQEKQGGLELLVRVRALANELSSEAMPSFQFVERKPIFASRPHVREGIAFALSPFLPALPDDEP